MSEYVRCRIEEFGDPDVIEVVRQPEPPSPGPGEVRISVEASSVQFTDTIIRRGKYPDAGPTPIVLGYDVVGRVDAVGAGAEPWKVGDRVADLTVTGGNTSHLVRKAEGLVRVPDDVDAAEAASLVLSGVTAYQMLFRHAGVGRGARILVQGGNGAVGWFANQLAVQAGVDVWTTARPEHHERLRALGTHPLDYRDPDYPAAIVEQTGGGVDVVFDGQGADRFRPSLASLKRGGKLVMIGASQAVNRGGSMIVAGALVLARNLNPFGPRVSLYSITTTRKRHPAWFGEDLGQLFEKLQRQELDVRVERRIDYDQVAQAHADLERGGVSGKVVLVTR